MAKKKKRAVTPRKRKPKRRATYVLLKKSEKKQIREFSKFIPSLDQYRGLDRLSSAQYSALQRAKKKLRHTENLKPLTEKQAKKLKGKTVGGGIRALRLRNVVEGDSHSKVVKVTNAGVVVTSNARIWEYHPVKSRSADGLADALISEGLRLFHSKDKTPFALHIWTGAGRSNEGSTAPEKWVQQVLKFFGAYQNSTEFILGVAALVRDVGGKKRKPLGKAMFKNLDTELENEDEEE